MLSKIKSWASAEPAVLNAVIVVGVYVAALAGFAEVSVDQVWEVLVAVGVVTAATRRKVTPVSDLLER